MLDELATHCNLFPSITGNGFVKQHLAVYGDVRIPRGYCDRCQGWALIVDRRLACCDTLVGDEKPSEHKRMSVAVGPRRQPDRETRDRLLEEFDHSCAYCARRFGLTVFMSGRRRVLKLNWDHLVPWSYENSSAAENFLPACDVCNHWKYNHVFSTIEEIRTFVAIKWAEYTGPEGAPSRAV